MRGAFAHQVGGIQQLVRADGGLRRLLVHQVVGVFAHERGGFLLRHAEVVAEPLQRQTRRLRHAASNDLLTLEKLNALSRRICTAPPSIEEFQRQLNAILAQHPDPRLHLAGSVLAASSFAIFFGGNLWDGLLAGGIAVLICWMERYLSPFCMNGVEFQFIASFLSGVSTLLLCRFGMQFHADKVLIGIIMLLIPGIMLTNSIRDILLGDIISGSLRLVEAILMAATLALGMMAAIWLMGGISA